MSATRGYLIVAGQRYEKKPHTRMFDPEEVEALADEKRYKALE
jgi:hypothetical protein